MPPGRHTGGCLADPTTFNVQAVKSVEVLFAARQRCTCEPETSCRICGAAWAVHWHVHFRGQALASAHTCLVCRCVALLLSVHDSVVEEKGACLQWQGQGRHPWWPCVLQWRQGWRCPPAGPAPTPPPLTAPAGHPPPLHNSHVQTHPLHVHKHIHVLVSTHSLYCTHRMYNFIQYIHYFIALTLGCCIMHAHHACTPSGRIVQQPQVHTDLKVRTCNRGASSVTSSYNPM